MLKDEYTKHEAKELGLVEIWSNGCLWPDKEISFNVKAYDGGRLTNCKFKTENARFFLYCHDEGYEDDLYVVCPRKYVEEGKKLLVKGYAYYTQKQIDELDEKMNDLKERKKKLEEKYSSMPDVDESKFATFCTVKYDDEKGWQINKKEVYRADGYKKDISVEETLSRKEHFVNKAFEINVKNSEVVGKCWKEDLEACKRMVLDKRISLIKQQEDEYAKKVDVGSVLADRFKEMLNEQE